MADGEGGSTGEIMRVLPESGARQNYNLGDVIPSPRNGLHIPRRWEEGVEEGVLGWAGERSAERTRAEAAGAKP